VRAPGVKWTALAPIRDLADGVAIGSMKTEPVNQSLGPGLVSRLFLAISRASLLSVGGVALPHSDVPVAV